MPRAHVGTDHYSPGMAKPRVHEIANELGVDSKVVLAALKDMGEYVRSPSWAIEAPVARRLRAVIRGEPDGQVSTQSEVQSNADASRRPRQNPELPLPTTVLPAHPEAAWATVRRNLLLRAESDWAAFGLGESRKMAWIRVGLPENKAHIAAMFSGPEALSPSVLLTRMPSGNTALWEALTGTNGVRIRQRIARLRGIPVVFRDELLTLLGKPEPEGHAEEVATLVERIQAIEPSPTALPTLTSTMSRLITAASRADFAALRLAAAARTYLDNGTIEPLLSDFAHAHGVMSAGAHLTTLAEAAVTYVEATRKAQQASASVLLRAAAESRRYLFVDADVAGSLDGAPGPLEVPPLPSGIAYLHREDGPGEVLVWTTVASGLRCALFDPGSLGPRDPRPSIVTFDDRSEEPAARALRGITRLRTPALEPRGGNRSAPKSAGPEPDVSASDDADARHPSVVLHYRSDAGGDGSTGPSRARRRPDHRWEVRAHPRRQWYPSAKEHRVIWIDDHTAGPADRPLIRVDQVEVL